MGASSSLMSLQQSHALGRPPDPARGAAPLAQSVHIVGAASGLGARDRGCALGPDALRHSGVCGTLNERSVQAVWDHTVRRPVLRSGMEPVAAIRDYCSDLIEVLWPVLRAGRRLVVLGGDHSCAIATWSAVSQSIQGPLGLVWIDAHMDSHTPETSPSGALHGMPLAILLGHGAPELVGLLSSEPKLRPEHVCLLGVRSYEPAEAALLQRLQVRVIGMAEIAKQGMDWALREACAIAGRGSAAIGLSIDLDAIDPVDAPGVGTPAPDGLRAPALIRALEQATLDMPFSAIEIAEYNPLRDHDGRTARLVAELLAAVLARPAGIEP